MKTLLLILFFTTLTFSIFAKDEKPKETNGNDLVCRQIKIIAGDDSKIVKLMESLTSGSGDDGLLSGAAIVRCENSTSICYSSSGSTFTCHKK
jgi:hypothetical protein